MTNRAWTTTHEKERYLLDRPSKWKDFSGLSHVEQKEVLTELFRDMQKHGYYSPSVSAIDGRVSVRVIIQRLLARGCDGVRV